MPPSDPPREVVVVPAGFFRGLSGSGYGRKAIARPVAPGPTSPTSPTIAPNSTSSTAPLRPATSVDSNPESVESALAAAEDEEKRRLSNEDDEATTRQRSTSAAEPETDAVDAQEHRVDLVLLLAKCAVPALFVAFGGAVAIPGERWLSESMRVATEEMAAGALLVTYAFELTKGYTLHDSNGELSYTLVAASFLGTVLSGQLQAAAQGMWPYGTGDGGGMGDALPFLIGYFVDGVVLAYDTPPPPTEEELLAEEAEEASPTEEAEEGFPVETTPKKKGGYSKTPVKPTGNGSKAKACKPKVSGSCRRMCRKGWRRVSPALSVLTFVVSIDNFVSGLGVMPKLDTTEISGIAYYGSFCVAVFLGGFFTAMIRRIPSEALQAGWFAFGAFSIIDGGLELATQGLTEFVLIGFMIVWVILLAG